MFEWTKIEDEMEFKSALRENPWLRKFLMSYCFDEGFIYFNEKKVLSGMGISELGKSQNFKQQLTKHVNERRKDMVGTPMHLQSFQYLLYVIARLRKNVRNHYEAVVPFLVMLEKEDVPFVVDILTKKFKLSNTQLRVLKGGY